MERIYDLIISSQYEQAFCELKLLPDNSRWEYLCNEVFQFIDAMDKSVYCFLLYCFSREQQDIWLYHCCTFLIYYQPICDDSMCLASWHLTEAIRLAPDNIKYKQAYINDFWTYPVKYVPSKTFLTYANDVILCFPKDKRAREILKS